MVSAADYLLSNKRYILKALEAIAQGYPTSGADDRYIIVNNPDYQEDGSHDPQLVIDTLMFREFVKRLEG